MIAAAQQNACTNPINSGTGNKYQREIDYDGEGVYPLHADHIYNSGVTSPSVIEPTVWGSQWRGFYDRSIAFTTNSVIITATVKRDGGQQYYYHPVNGVWVGDVDVVGTLVETGVDASGNPTGWIYTNESDEVETYNASGKLVSITNRHGQTQTLTYSCMPVSATCPVATPATVAPVAGLLITVTDPAGRSLNFFYDGASRVVKMTDPAGGVYTYAYSGTFLTDNLTAVIYPDGKVRTYLYGETANVSAIPATGVSYAHALTGVVDEDGNRYASWTYDAQGRAASSEHGLFGSGIDHVRLAYGTPDANGNSTTSVTDPRGNVRNYTFSTLLGVVKNTGITGQPCNGCSAAFNYDANGNVSSRTDFNGNTTCYTYDLTRNLETVRLEGLPAGTACPASLTGYVPPTTAGSVIRMATTQWNTSYRLPAEVAEPLRITTYTYDYRGNLLTKTIQPTSDATGGAGQTATATGTPRTWTYTYNTAGQVLTVDGPRTDVTDITTYAYDVQENLSTVTNALSQTTTLGSYDANGRPGIITDPNGQITDLFYDARGRLTSRTTGGETTSYTYDGIGQLINITTPSGAAYTYSYDAAHRLTGIADNLGSHINYTLDVMGNRTHEQIFDAAGNLVKTHSRVFDSLNHLYQDIGAVNQTTTFSYDANGNLTSITDPLSRHTSQSYDALNRLISSTDAASGLTQYGYDALDQLVQVTDPNSLITQYTRNGMGDLDQRVSPDTGTTVNTYDAAGNVLTRTDAKGQVASYTYDALNRVTTISYSGGAPAPQTLAYQYDQGINGIGHLTDITDVTGITSYSYDTHGRLTNDVRQAHGLIYTTAYGYDTQGRLAGINYPSGRVVNYSFDGMGRINQIATTFNGVTNILTSNIVYEPFGGVHSFDFGDGVTAPVQSYTRLRDQDGRIASYTLNGRVITIGYDAASQIGSITDSQYPLIPAGYGYDQLSRLTSYFQGSIAKNYSYDADGNRVSQLLGSTTNYSYAPGSNRLASIQAGERASQPVAQDANGTTTSDATRQYSYDLRGRLVQVITTQGTINYEVNALGLRVRKQVPYASTDTLYHYDLQGHLIGESATGAIQFSKEYIYLGDQPVAVLQ